MAEGVESWMVSSKLTDHFENPCLRRLCEVRPTDVHRLCEGFRMGWCGRRTGVCMELGCRCPFKYVPHRAESEGSVKVAYHVPDAVVRLIALRLFHFF
jgi:hypothetical protein